MGYGFRKLDRHAQKRQGTARLHLPAMFRLNEQYINLLSKQSQSQSPFRLNASLTPF